MQRKGVKIGFTGFVIALVGAVVGVAGFHFEQRWLAITGFAITVVGVAVGFIGIGYAWITEGRQALAGSVDAARKLRKMISSPNSDKGSGPN